MQFKETEMVGPWNCEGSCKKVLETCCVALHGDVRGAAAVNSPSLLALLFDFACVEGPVFPAAWSHTLHMPPALPKDLS